MSRLQNHAIYALLALAGAFALGTIALNRGETVNAVWIVVAAVGDLPDRLSLLQPVHRDRVVMRLDPDAADAGGAPQ